MISDICPWCNVDLIVTINHDPHIIIVVVILMMMMMKS